jgi:hypothetical protein
MLRRQVDLRQGTPPAARVASDSGQRTKPASRAAKDQSPRCCFGHYQRHGRWDTFGLV